jgi:hypothetical protein
MSTHGYVPYNPNEDTRYWLKAARHVLATYEAWESPMTVRQVFYRLVAEFSYDKTEGAYGSLVNYIARSRRAFHHRALEVYRTDETLEDFSDAQSKTLDLEPTLIPFSWIRDEKGQSIAVTSYDGMDDFLENCRNAAKAMKLDRQTGQPRVIELWCEAAGMVPLMREIAGPYGIRVSSGGGYDSVTAKHNLARRTAATWLAGKRETLVLHIGDFDPSGEGMYETLNDDVSEMVWGLVGRDVFGTERIALREEQVISMNIETAPPKPQDSRRRSFVANHPQAREHFGSDNITAQLEALTPPDLRTLIVSMIDEKFDDEAYAEVRRQEDEIREELLERLS